MGLNENRPWCDKIFFIFTTFFHHKKSCQQNPLADTISRFRTTEADNFSFWYKNGYSPQGRIPAPNYLISRFRTKETDFLDELLGIHIIHGDVVAARYKRPVLRTIAGIGGRGAYTDSRTVDILWNHTEQSCGVYIRCPAQIGYCSK